MTTPDQMADDLREVARLLYGDRPITDVELDDARRALLDLLDQTPDPAGVTGADLEDL